LMNCFSKIKNLMTEYFAYFIFIFAIVWNFAPKTCCPPSGAAGSLWVLMATHHYYSWWRWLVRHFVGNSHMVTTICTVCCAILISILLSRVTCDRSYFRCLTFRHYMQLR
jgi:hypothetical protein